MHSSRQNLTTQNLNNVLYISEGKLIKQQKIFTIFNFIFFNQTKLLKFNDYFL